MSEDGTRALPPGLAEAWQATARRFGLDAGLITGEAAMAPIRRITRQAYEIEAVTPATWLESARLMRIGPQAIATHRDGIGLNSPFVRALHTVGLFDPMEVPQRGQSTLQRVMDRWGPFETGSGYLWLGSTGNERATQIAAGRAYVRLPGRLRPTERAHALHATVTAMKTAAQEAERLFAEAGAQVAGTVRLAVSEVYATHVVAPLAAQWLAEQPGLEIELSVSNRAENLLRRDADIAVRFFRPEQDDVIAVHVGTTELGLYAHESFIARHGEPTDYTLPEAAFVAGFDRESAPLAPLYKGPPPPQPVRFRLRTDAVLARQVAGETGLGVGVYLVDLAAERPGLRRVLAKRFGQPQEVWLCAHPELRRSASMRFVWDRLEQALRRRLAPLTVPPAAPPTSDG